MARIIKKLSHTISFSIFSYRLLKKHVISMLEEFNYRFSAILVNSAVALRYRERPFINLFNHIRVIFMRIHKNKYI